MDLLPIFKDLHANPELAFQEQRTSAIVAKVLSSLGIDTTEGVAGTGVVGVLRNGEGPVVLLRADMDGLPVEETTGLAYASTQRGVDHDGNDVPLMHACGHDVHVVCLLGAAEELTARLHTWSGTAVFVFQPAEEHGGGAQAMVDAGLYDRVPVPDVVLGQHVTAVLPAGTVALSPGASLAASDSLRIDLFGRGGHGSAPETTLDPVFAAAAIVMRMQAIVSREVAAAQTAVVTVGSIEAGTKATIVPPSATIRVSVRTYDERVRTHVLDAITRIVDAEVAASRFGRPAEIVSEGSAPVTFNDPSATDRVVGALIDAFGEGKVIELPPRMASEDVGNLATAVNAPLVYWRLGGANIEEWSSRGASAMPSNHSPDFAVDPEPTLRTGVGALVAAALEWLRPSRV